MHLFVVTRYTLAIIHAPIDLCICLVYDECSQQNTSSFHLDRMVLSTCISILDLAPTIASVWLSAADYPRRSPPKCTKRSECKSSYKQLAHTALYTAVQPLPHSTFCSNSTVRPLSFTLFRGVIWKRCISFRMPFADVALSSSAARSRG